jgi:hypothetical protein
MFRKNPYGDTPFQLGCKTFAYEKVMKVVEDTLTRYSDAAPPLNIAEALLSAAIDENVNLDCVYFLLRRQLDVLVKLLSSSPSSSSITTMNRKGDDCEDSTDTKVGVNSLENLINADVNNNDSYESEDITDTRYSSSKKRNRGS